MQCASCDVNVQLSQQRFGGRPGDLEVYAFHSVRFLQLLFT